MTWAGWIYPLPTLGDGRSAVISDGFKAVQTDDHRQHLGVDVMYRRSPMEPAELPRGSKGYYVPANTPVLAAFGGKIASANITGYGHSVSIDHGVVPGIGHVVTFYQHMSSYARPWKVGDRVSAGEKLGIVGGSLTGYPLHHLHFEMWLPTRANAINPAPYMALWQRRTSANIALPLILLGGAAVFYYLWSRG